MMRVFYTVDTEYWPRNPKKPDFTELELDIQRDIYGYTREGEFGLRYQLDALDSEGLKGVFFVEPISALKSGLKYLNEIIFLIESRGHSVELHLHTEWLDWIESPPLSRKNIQFLSQLSVGEQITLISRGLVLFKDAGLKNPVCAFRAGNYGANRNTLQALAKKGITYDSSYNRCYLDSTNGFKIETPLLQAQWIDDILEVPISFFEDFRGHYRHIQLMAISFEEMRLALETAERQGWNSFVIVSHSFELLKRNCNELNSARADYFVIDRFHKLIKYLGENKERYIVDGFKNISEIDLVKQETGSVYSPLQGSLLNTLSRYMQQAARRLYK